MPLSHVPYGEYFEVDVQGTRVTLCKWNRGIGIRFVKDHKEAFIIPFETYVRIEEVK